MEPLVAEIMGLIEAGADDPRLRWSPDRMTVQVVLSRLILGGTPKLAASGRRDGFGEAWQAARAQHGWLPTGERAVFAPPAAEAETRAPPGPPRPPVGW